MKVSHILAILCFCHSGLIANQPLFPSAESIRTITTKVADWQIENFENSGEFRGESAWDREKTKERGSPPEKWHDLDWHMGALYAGLNQFRKVAEQPQKYTQFLRSIGERNDWKLHRRPYHADDHAVGQMYLALYDEFEASEMLEPTREQFDWILSHPKTGSLQWMTKEMRQNKQFTDCHKRWGWCDALFMAPPVWAHLAKITGDQKYLDFMDREYRATYDLLWNEDDQFFWRDTTFFERREKNGRNLYWARGNGWVFGGLALMIPNLPEDWGGRAFYVELYQQMAASVMACQREDGTWSMGLLGGIEGYPVKETSGTSFYTFGLAWGINNGLLDADLYMPVVMKAWNALTDSVTEEGMLGYVQPVGAAPGDSFPDKTEVYGVGAFLAAGAEVYRLSLKE